jgi:hypothetical protein
MSRYFEIPQIADQNRQKTQKVTTDPSAAAWGDARFKNFEIFVALSYYRDYRRTRERIRPRLALKDATGVGDHRPGATCPSTREDHQMETDKLLQAEIRVINIGLREFAHDMRSCNVPVVHVDWSPPAVTDPRIASLLAKLGG